MVSDGASDCLPQCQRRLVMRRAKRARRSLSLRPLVQGSNRGLRQSGSFKPGSLHNGILSTEGDSCFQARGGFDDCIRVVIASSEVVFVHKPGVGSTGWVRGSSSLSPAGGVRPSMYGETNTTSYVLSGRARAAQRQREQQVTGFTSLGDLVSPRQRTLRGHTITRHQAIGRKWVQRYYASYSGHLTCPGSPPLLIRRPI